MNKYNNYHCHTHYSNVQTIDSTSSSQDYIDRIKEIGYGCLFSTEHGWQSNYLEKYDLAKKNNIPFRFGVEAYWVLDNKQKDKTNNHIIILAKNENGMKKINLALSYANIEGYYYKPRLSLQDILNLPKDDVFITTACIGFNGYGNQVSKDVILQLKNKFDNNFMLEVQSHNTDKQKEWNKFLLDLSVEYNIQLISGVDSHYIYEKDNIYRDNLLKSKGMNYEDEEGWFLDFPSYEILFDRFKNQNILNDDDIEKAIKNTLVIDSFENIEFNKNIKIPNIFPDKTYKERVELFKNILRDSWKIESVNIPKEKHPKYIEEIKKEINIVTTTKTVDYFILNYYIVRRAKELGGELTLTSRGSAPSFYINKLLGFTTIDRISSLVQMFPERFMSISRILKSDGTIGSIPDIDFNSSNPEVFLQAQREILGENSSYYMIAFGKLKGKSAFKTYARANGIDFNTSNEISKSITNYELDKKHKKKELDISDYIDKKYIDMFNESKEYKGVIESASPHPCAVLCYGGNILEDIGIIKLKDSYVTVLDGLILDSYKYVKNDFLKVNVVQIIYEVFRKIGIEPITASELIKITENDEKTWSMFHKGITLGLNQVEQEGTKNKCMQYKPSNISELSAFVASVRPGFASMLDIFLKRENFVYGIKDFDNLIQTEQMTSSFLIYQEQILQTLEYAGFPMDECYGLIKAIAKKIQGVVDKVKDRFIEGFINKGNSLEDAEKVWKVIEDNSDYSFNASHSYSVALDSLYGAYLKAYYPYEFYKVMLELYSENKDIEKVSLLKKEMQYFDIHIGELKFGLDNTGFVIDKKNNKINQSLKTVKYINSSVCEEMRKLNIDNHILFPEVVKLIKEHTSTNSGQLDVLIKIGYFEEFGSIKKCLTFMEYYDKLKKKTYKKDDISKELEEYIKPFSKETEKLYRDLDKEIIFENIWNNISDDEIDINEKIGYELEFLGYIKSKIPEDKSIAKCLMCSIKHKSVNLQSFKNNQTRWFKLDSGLKMINKGDVVDLEKISTKKGYQGRTDYVIKRYTKL